MKERPVNLNFLTLYFPITAWVSILHRLSGLFLFLVIPGLLWILEKSLLSAESFEALQKFLHKPMVYVGIWFFFVALFYHGIAGIRHLCLDLHWGESKKAGHFSAWLVLAIVLVFALWLGYYRW